MLPFTKLVGPGGLVTTGGDWEPGAAAGGSSDPFWSSVLLLLGNNQGANGVALTDTNANGGDLARNPGPNGRAVTFTNAPTWSTATPPSGLTSTISLGGTQLLSVPDSADWAFTGQFCFEIFWRPADATQRRLFVIGNNDDSRALLMEYVANTFSTDIVLNIGTTSEGFEWFTGPVTGPSYDVNIWYYLSLYRDANVDLYLADGVLGGNTNTPVLLNAAATGTLANVTPGLAVGLGFDGGTNGLSGLLGPFRVTASARGRGSSAFAIPSLPLPTATT
jgi:hypothetical protein